MPLWDGLNLQALVLDAVTSQLDPLTLSALLLLHFPFSVFHPPLRILVLSPSSPWISLTWICILSLFMVFCHLNPCPLSSSSASVDSPSAAVLLPLISSTGYMALWLSLHYKRIIVYKILAFSVAQWSGAVRKESGPSFRQNLKMEQNSNTQSFTRNTLSAVKIRTSNSMKLSL